MKPNWQIELDANMQYYKECVNNGYLNLPTVETIYVINKIFSTNSYHNPLLEKICSSPK